MFYLFLPAITVFASSIQRTTVYVQIRGMNKTCMSKDLIQMKYYCKDLYEERFVTIRSELRAFNK